VEQTGGRILDDRKMSMPLAAKTGGRKMKKAFHVKQVLRADAG
jgi:hypothetical protein